MKKVKIGIFCLFLGVFVLGGCRKVKTEEAISSKESSSLESSFVESSISQSEDSSMAADDLSDSEEDSSYFDLMIEAAQSQISSMKAQFGDTYKDMTITRGEGHTIVYTYTLAQPTDTDVDVEALKPTLIKSIKPTMDAAKQVISDVKIQVIFLNPDGSEIVNFTITQEDTDAVDEVTS